MCNGANYSTVHRHDLGEQTIWIWRHLRWHCYMPHNVFWKHEFPFFKMSRSCFCGENACSRCLNPRQLYEGNTGQYLAILGSTTIVGNRVLNASVLASKARQGIPQITYSLSLASLAIYKGTLFVCFLRVKLLYGIVRQNSNHSLNWT